jgi:hypothetical protein
VGRQLPLGFALALALAAAGPSLALGGCGGGEEPPPPPPEPGIAVIALGGTAPDGSGFLPLEGDVVLAPGAQGGFHVWVKYRVSGMPAGPVNLAYTARRSRDARLVLTANRYQELGAPSTDGYWEVPMAIPAFMCPSPVGVQVMDEPMRFKLEMLGMDGTWFGTGEAEVTPHCPEGDQATFCARICSG